MTQARNDLLQVYLSEPDPSPDRYAQHQQSCLIELVVEQCGIGEESIGKCAS